NHMGIGHADNKFWLDVLEWGRASPHAGFFDINWDTRQPNLRNKVLVPLLGDQYGHVLERGELQLRFETDTGSFSVWYFEARCPIHALCYHRILDVIDPDLRRQASSVAQGTEAAARSVGEKIKEELARFAQPDALSQAADRFNGEPGKQESFAPLHDLLEQ